jgi:hypothetical protein
MARPGCNTQVTVEPEKIGRQLPPVDIHAINPTIHAEKTTIVQPHVEFMTHVVDPVLQHDLPPQFWWILRRRRPVRRPRSKVIIAGTDVITPIVVIAVGQRATAEFLGQCPTPSSNSRQGSLFEIQLDVIDFMLGAIIRADPSRAQTCSALFCAYKISEYLFAAQLFLSQMH